MHRATVPPASLDFILPSSQSHFKHRSSPSRHGGWPRIDSNSSVLGSASISCQQRALELPRASSATYSLPQITPGYLPAPTRDGLRTPPADDMNSTTFQPQQHHSYGPRQDSSYPAAGPFGVAPVSKHHAAHTHSRGISTSNLSNVVSSNAKSYGGHHSPGDASTVPHTANIESSKEKSLILPSLQIPDTVNNSGGSLGEFAAQITCLFWFENTETLRKAETWSSQQSPVRRLVPDAIPTVSFRKWVVTILSTTQVTQNVILLALLFIYRLKTLNPTVKGKAGSEYRLLTVALMLGNKFLDDNTYTNKTWAEVSGISVGEIHVMEVEFLSNMRYSLLASKEQWKEWQVKLGKFAQYFEMAARAPVSLPSPGISNQTTVLPSPPSSMQASPPALSTYPPNSVAYNYNQQWSSNYNAPLVSPLPSMPEMVPELSLRPVDRKRSYDEVADEPPAKRVTRSAASQPPPASSAPPPRHLGRLPVPNLSISTSQSMGYPSFAQTLPLPLPPLSGRAMSTVYPTTPSWTPQQQMSLTPTTLTHPSTSQSLPGTNFGTPSRRHSPRSVQELISMNSSPISAHFPSHDHNSPSFFLQQRNSPYRPVRLPNTLLYPPPSASMHNNFPPASISQMHYQPLGKRTDHRPGLVPEYAPHSGYSHWSLPQPHFNN